MRVRLRVVDDQVAGLLALGQQVALEAVEEVLVHLLALGGLARPPGPSTAAAGAEVGSVVAGEVPPSVSSREIVYGLLRDGSGLGAARGGEVHGAQAALAGLDRAAGVLGDPLGGAALESRLAVGGDQLQVRRAVLGRARRAASSSTGRGGSRSSCGAVLSIERAMPGAMADAARATLGAGRGPARSRGVGDGARDRARSSATAAPRGA